MKKLSIALSVLMYSFFALGIYLSTGDGLISTLCVAPLLLLGFVGVRHGKYTSTVLKNLALIFCIPLAFYLYHQATIASVFTEFHVYLVLVIFFHNEIDVFLQKRKVLFYS